MGLFEKMRSEGGDVGSVVELILKEGGSNDRRTTVVPTYRGPSELAPSDRPSESFVAYVGGFGEYDGESVVFLSSSKGGDHLGESERRGRVNVLQSAVAAYTVLRPATVARMSLFEYLKSFLPMTNHDGENK